MANTTQQRTKTKQLSEAPRNAEPECETEIVRRVAWAFPLLLANSATEPGDSLSANDAADMLGIWADYDCDELGALMRMGLLRGDDGAVTKAEMLRFLEQHGDAWVLERLEMLRHQLREGLAASKEAA